MVDTIYNGWALQPIFFYWRLAGCRARAAFALRCTVCTIFWLKICELCTLYSAQNFAIIITELRKGRRINMEDIKKLACALIEMGVDFTYQNHNTLIHISNYASTCWYARVYNGKILVYGDFCFDEYKDEEEVSIDILIRRIKMYYDNYVL